MGIISANDEGKTQGRNMVGKRKHSRYVVVGMGISAKTTHKTEVEILDISIGGCSVRGTRRFCMNGEYIFKFELSDRVISMKGSIVWEKMTGVKKISEEEAMPVYTAGIQFKDVLSEKALELKGFIADKLKEYRLGSVRIKLHTPEKTVLNYLETCVVKDISLGGMRIEAEQEALAETVFLLELVFAENEHLINCKGRVAFCLETPEKTQQRYSVGVEFIDMGAQDTLRLGKFIESLPTDIGAM
jgi:c-di-GMP-binding flagellar brake protein YcgR